MTAHNKQALREHYSPKPVPKCHICGAEMTIQRMSVIRTTYGCTGATYDDKGCHYAEGRNIADDHYAQSSVTVVDLSDPEVLAVLDELEATESKCRELAAELSAVDKIHNEAVFITDDHYEQCPPEVQKMIRSLAVLQIPAYDAFLAEARAQVWIEGSEPEEFGRYWVRYETDVGPQYCSAEWMEYNFCAGSNTNIHKIWLADHSRSINSLRGVTHYTKLPDSLEGAAQWTALNKQAIDFSQPLETENGEPVKYICHDVIEYKCARVCVDIATGVVYSSPYVGLKIRNKETTQRAKLREQIESAADAYWQFDNGWISDMKCGDLSHEYLLFVKEPKNVLALLSELDAAEKTSAARLEAIDRAHKMFQREKDRAEAAEKRIAELQIARDKCFLKGLKTGWEYGIADETEGYNREIADAEAVIDRAAGIGVKGE